MSGRDGKAESLFFSQGRMDVSRAGVETLAHVSVVKLPGLFCLFILGSGEEPGTGWPSTFENSVHPHGSSTCQLCTCAGHRQQTTT